MFLLDDTNCVVFIAAEKFLIGHFNIKIGEGGGGGVALLAPLGSTPDGWRIFFYRKVNAEMKAEQIEVNL